MNIPDVYNDLQQSDKELLNYAFENKVSQLVELPERRFIGVNLYPTKYMVIEVEQNSWSLGHFEEGI